MMTGSKRSLLAVVCFLTLLGTKAQQYGYDQEYGQDYGQDSLYHDYAMKQQEKEIGKA
jgi:hypothetical protein